MERKSYRSIPVMVGYLPLGGDYTVRVQSITNTDTLDVDASVAQCIRIIEAGGELVRLTTQGIKEVESLEKIHEKLHKMGFSTPLVADIHFNPKVAEMAASVVEKIRINPGNYVDKRAKFEKLNLSDKEYEEELERIHERVLPLIDICKRNNTVIRVGINHGSLSDRIMSRYGNTPEGMVASAMEFIRIFQSENFSNLVLSMKSSNTMVMANSTRQLVDAMQKEGYAFPLHLGVTEAGEGEDGRIRSAAGIGALLAEGIGDTIRVSLSEPPENEIPVAQKILRTVAGPTKRVVDVADTLLLNDRPSYKPIVIQKKADVFINEDEEPFTGQFASIKDEEITHFPSGTTNKVILFGSIEKDREELAIKAASTCGRYFIFKQASGICILDNKIDNSILKEISLSILQATEARITRNKYISCPTCGRTKYDLQSAVKRVKEATKHLTGLKIAIMGCVVNGPGEMAGADYGYVGASEGKIHIYKGITPVLKNVPQEVAVEKLLEVINANNKHTSC
ncbi:MAG: (E)-4-hydroxy-3-methylbut-2-enyl-diphosphate synthase [Bacteroidales bacterium]|nr:(E)-4-hydroxy-3-methylbut-2-enyl-diphosphate synthase [Bacteroidales bacterium]